MFCGFCKACILQKLTVHEYLQRICILFTCKQWNTWSADKIKWKLAFLYPFPKAKKQKEKSASPDAKSIVWMISENVDY